MELESCTLSALAARLKLTIKNDFSTPVWVRAEISELRENANGNCYLELIERQGDRVLARQKAVVMSFTYRMLKPYFEGNTGMTFSAGIAVLVACVYDFHEVYGLSLQIKDIEPAFTVGEAAKRKLQIIRQLTDEGVVDMNKQLIMSEIPNRIAIISSATAAGYGDFVDQLTHNTFGYKFYCHLFPAVMQGNATEESIIQALDRIIDHLELFDVVAIVRGGGATAELATFDNYNIAAHCAQFPLPIIAGIGHQRDDTVLDVVAHKSVKTPTAVAEFLVDCMRQTEEILDEKIENFSQNVQAISLNHHQKLYEKTLQLRHATRNFLSAQSDKIRMRKLQLVNATDKKLLAQKQKIDNYERTIRLLNPQTLLRKGYTLTLKNGRTVTSKTALRAGDCIETVFVDGKVASRVEAKD